MHRLSAQKGAAGGPQLRKSGGPELRKSGGTQPRKLGGSDQRKFCTRGTSVLRASMWYLPNGQRMRRRQITAAGGVMKAIGKFGEVLGSSDGVNAGMGRQKIAVALAVQTALEALINTPGVPSSGQAPRNLGAL
jgi:hypothetical protein